MPRDAEGVTAQNKRVAYKRLFRLAQAMESMSKTLDANEIRGGEKLKKYARDLMKQVPKSVLDGWVTFSYPPK